MMYDDAGMVRLIRAVFGPPRTTDNGDGTYSHVWSFDPPELLALPEHVDSDSVSVSLADDVTWCHMRSLYPSPELLEGC